MEQENAMRPFLRILILGAILIGGGSISHPRAVAGNSLQSITAELSPILFRGPSGWRNLCMRNHEICIAGHGDPVVELTPSHIRSLTDVHRLVVNMITPVSEPPGQDQWLLAPLAGDCDDYALTFRSHLLDAGWPSAALSFVLALTEIGEPHVSLAIETTDGTIILDNRMARPVHWHDLQQAGYIWLGVENRDGSGTWSLTRSAVSLVQVGGRLDVAY